MTRLGLVVAVLALLAAGCAGDDDEGRTTATPAGRREGPQSVVVEVDGEAATFAMAADAYFPDAMTLHPGDTVRFHSNGSGEPHTVTFGTVVDQALEARQGLDEELPRLLEEQGAGDRLVANPLAANPCFAVGELPPADRACPTLAETPAFDGRHAFYNSGYLPDNETFEVKLADDLAPGTYNYVCLLHGEGMTGRITVVPVGREAQSAGDVAEAGEEKLEELVAGLRPQARLVARASDDEAMAGAPPVGDGEQAAARVVEFGPASLSIPVGTTVSWAVFGGHTISFNVPESAVGMMTRAPDGTWQVNRQAVAPAGGSPPPPSDDGRRAGGDGPSVVIDGADFDGSGFKSSGLIRSSGPRRYRYQVTFTKVGTYKVRCLVHPAMEATLRVR